MNSTPKPVLRAAPRALACALSLGFLLAGPSRANDRFIVPVGGGNSSTSSSSSQSSSSNSSSGSSSSGSSSSSESSGGTYSPRENTGERPTRDQSGRFLVPMPPRPGGGGGHSGGGHGGWHDSWDPYWSGSFYHDGWYHYWDGSCYSPFWGHRARYRFGYPSVVYIRERSAAEERDDGLRFFFPPEPPPIGTPPPPAPPAGKQRLLASAQLAAHVMDPFYAQLGTRLHRRNLTQEQLDALAAYRAEKAGLLAELHARIAAVQSLEPAARRANLQAIAQEQTPRVEALEATAESLRTGLLRVGLVASLHGTGDWSEKRAWRLGVGSLELPREETLAFEFQVIRAAAFYQDGLSPAQRRLLRELSTELQVQAFRPATVRNPGTDDGLSYFSPETARIRFSEGLPVSLATRLAAYQQARRALKDQLREALYSLDRVSTKERVAELRQLAAAQAPALEASEELAELIRIEIYTLGRRLRPPAIAPLPEALAARVAAYNREKASLQLELDATLTGRAEPVNGTSSAPVGATVTESLAHFDARNRDRFARLEGERQALSAELAQLPGMTGRAGSPVETMLKAIEESQAREAGWSRYGDYQNAVLLPGLSPAQRRLLYAGAIESLSLPLPDGSGRP